jgi:succinyl-diaminopimelate desuccinylase
VKQSDQTDFSIDRPGLVAFAQKLVRCRSWNPPGDEAEAAALVAGELTTLGLEARVEPVAPGRSNVIGRLRGSGTGRGHMLLVGHLDTVPLGNQAWERDPLSGEVEGEFLYGRGSADMKGGLAAAVYAAGAIANSGTALAGDLIVAGTVGEEVDCLGARALAESGELQGVSAVAIPEPSGLDLSTAHKGALWVKITTQGKAAHGSRPDLGINAILHMQETIRRIVQADWSYPEHPLLGKPTVNVATIQGGTKTNMVPDRCELSIDFRTLPGQSHAERAGRLQDILDQLTAEIPGYQAVMEVINDKAAVSTPPGDPFVQAAQHVGRRLWGKELVPQGVAYYTDASVLASSTGAPVIILGPGEAGMAHQTDEWVSVDKLIQAAQFYAQLAGEWLQSGE